MSAKLEISGLTASFIIIILPVLLASCSFYSKDDYLKDFSEFVDDIETNFKDYTKEDWKLKEIDFQNYTIELYKQFKEELTEDDQILIGKLKTKYLIAKSEYEMKNLGDQIRDGFNQVKGAVNEVFSED